MRCAWKQCLSCLLLCLPVVSLFAAQEDSLSPVVVLGSRLGGDRNDPGATTVIGRNEIRLSGARTLADLLESRQGLHVERYGGEGQMASLSIRGAAGERVLILQDGIPLNPAQGGGVDLASVDLRQVERVEIYRSGSSARYGENAFGGIINLVSRSVPSTLFTSRLSLGYGSFDTSTLGLALSGAPAFLPGWRAMASVQRRESAGGYLFPGQQKQLDSGELVLEGSPVAHLNTGFSALRVASLIAYNSERFQVDMRVTWHQREAGVPGTIEFPTSEAVQRDKSLLFSLRGGWRKLLLDRDHLSIRAYSTDQQRLYRDFQLFDQQDSHHNSAWGLNLTYTAAPGRWQTELGLDYRNDCLRSTSYHDTFSAGDALDVSRERASLRYRLRWSSVPPGKRPAGTMALFHEARLDGYAHYPTAYTPRVGLILHLAHQDALLFKASAGRAYRVPSFNDLFWPESFFAAGNPQLRPEDAWTGDCGLILRPWSNLRGEAFFFFRETRDRILWSPSAGGLWRPTNLGRTSTRGLEAALKALFPLGMGLVLEATANYTLQFVQDAGEGATAGCQLPRIPFEKGACSVSLQVQDWFLRLGGRYLGFRYTNQANTKYLGDYFLLDVVAGLQLPWGLRLHCTLRNLLDTAYIHVLGYPVPGREWELGLDWKLP